MIKHHEFWFAFIAFLAASGAVADDRRYRLATVSYERKSCTYWTGDVGLTLKQFSKDLKEGFGAYDGLEISYRPQVPQNCLRAAVRAAKSAGYKAPKLVKDPYAGAFEPPLPHQEHP